MTQQGSLRVFQNTLQKTDHWLKEIMTQLNWEDRHRAYQALKGVLHALRDRLPAEIAVKVGAQLPMLIRGFYYEGWVPARTPIKIHRLEEFLELAMTYFNNASVAENLQETEQIVKTIFNVMREQLSEGEIEHIMKAVPEPIAALLLNKTSKV